MADPPPTTLLSAHEALLLPQASPVAETPIAKTTPLGFASFGLSIFVISCYNTGAFGVGTHDPLNVVVGLSLFYGGVGQVVAGMWDFADGNTFGATVLSSFGCFWLSFAVIFIPGFGITEAYLHSTPHSLDHALGILLLGWTIFNTLMLFAALHTSIAVISVLASATVTLVFLTLSKFINGDLWQLIAGYTGIVTSILAWYKAVADLLTEDNFFFVLPVGNIRGHYERLPHHSIHSANAANSIINAAVECSPLNDL